MSESGPGSPDSGSGAGGKDSLVECPTCDYTTETEPGLKQHHIKKHGEPLTTNYVCDGCGKGYESRPGIKRHLTDKCTDAGHRCDKCERAFPTYQGLMSHSAQVHGEQLGVDVVCAWCGKEDTVQPNRAGLGENYYCSDKCKGHGTQRGRKISPRVELTCTYCGDTFTVLKSQEDNRSMCGKECRLDYMSDFMMGENNPSWKGGYSRYYRKNWKRNRRLVRERDGYECQVCGIHEDENGRQLSVHHINPARQFDTAEEANRLENLIALCEPCHRKWEGIPLRPDARQ